MFDVSCSFEILIQFFIYKSFSSGKKFKTFPFTQTTRSAVIAAFLYKYYNQDQVFLYLQSTDSYLIIQLTVVRGRSQHIRGGRAS